jgi:hypothetical protein
MYWQCVNGAPSWTEKYGLSRGAEKQFPQYLTRRSSRPSKSPTSSFRFVPRYVGSSRLAGHVRLSSSEPLALSLLLLLEEEFSLGFFSIFSFVAAIYRN